MYFLFYFLSTESPVVRLVGGASHCAGRVETKHGVEWRPVAMNWWSLKAASVVCRELDCGSGGGPVSNVISASNRHYHALSAPYNGPVMAISHIMVWHYQLLYCDQRVPV